MVTLTVHVLVPWEW